MKTLTTLILVASLVVNGLLLYVLTTGPETPAAAAARPRAEAPSGERSSSTPDDATWQKLQAQDLRTMAASLNAGGFPPHVIHAIISAQVRDQSSARRKALQGDAQANPFWKNASVDPKSRAALRDLERQDEKLVRDILGSSMSAMDAIQDIYRFRGLLGVAPEHQAEAQRILREYEQQRLDYFRDRPTGGGLIGVELTQMENAMRAELAKVLTPAELEEYDLRAGNTAESLRFALAAFKPTEEEFRAIHALQRVFDEQFGRIGMPNPDQTAARVQAQKALTEQIKQVLGPERGAFYERATDYSYRSTAQLVARLELPPETTDQLYAVQTEVQQKQRTIMRSATSREEGLAQLEQLQNEALSKVTPLLGGTRGVEAYKQYGGTWLRTLVPRSSVPVAPPGGMPPRPPGS